MADYDILIIGGGPGGYVAAIKAAKAGRKVCICEKKDLGGVCLNEGCIPTKTLLKSVKMLANVKAAGDFGVDTECAASLKLDLGKVLKRKEMVIATLRNGIGHLLKHPNITLMRETARLTGRNEAMCGDERITFDNAIIATGSEAAIPPVSVEDGAVVGTSSDILQLDRIPGEVSVLGGGVVGVELAYYMAGTGSNVTILEQMDRILPMLDEEISSKVAAALKSRNVNIYTGVSVEKISAGEITYKDQNGENVSQRTEYTLIAAGRKPVIDEESMKAAGIEYDRKGIKVNDRMETSVQGIYAIGDVNGRMMLAHVASAEGEVAVDNICGDDKAVNYSVVPSCVYISPEIACIGMTEIQAKEKYDDVRIGRFPLMANGKAMLEGEPSGLCKVIINGGDDGILGFHMYGIHATDIAAAASVAMSNGIKASGICETIFAHPTVSECVHETFLNAYGKSIHI